MVLIQMTLETQRIYLRIVFIHNEECGNFKVFVDGGKLTGNINKKKKSGILQAYRCPVIEESISLIRMWNIVNQ